MNVINFLENSVEKYPTKLAIIDEKQCVTFQELYDKVKIFSSSMSTLTQNDIVGLVSENSISFVIAYLGILNAGKIAHLIPPEISKSNLLTQLKSSTSSIILCPFTIKNNFTNLCSIPIFSFDEIMCEHKTTIDYVKNESAYLLYTSGTTSDPKGVLISHEMIEFTTKNIISVLKYSNSDVDVLPLPLHHSFGLGCLHTSLMVSSTLVLLKNANNLEKILDCLKKYNATTLAAIPATLTKLLNFDMHSCEDVFSSLRLVVTNSTSIPKPTVENFKKILKNGNLSTYYGLTEASRSTFMIFEKTNGREESVGKPAPAVNIKISNAENNSVIGEIWIKGMNVIKKYWNNPESDKNIVDGWLKTGDIGFIDDENYLFLKGRIDDLINIGGEKVIPQEIEKFLKTIPGINDVAVFGIKNEVFDQTIKANVVKSKDSDVTKLIILRHCMKHLERFKIPSNIEFVHSLPKNEHGKIKRFMLK